MAAAEPDTSELAALHAAVARDLTERYGRGHWSYEPTENGVARAIRSSHVMIARLEGELVASFELQTRKPWSIDRAYFTEVPRPLYLLAMAVAPSHQRMGVGRWMLDAAIELALAWPAQAIRLDAYDADAGAGPFYAKCGFKELGRVAYRGTPLIYYERVLGTAPGSAR